MIIRPKKLKNFLERGLHPYPLQHSKPENETIKVYSYECTSSHSEISGYAFQAFQLGQRVKNGKNYNKILYLLIFILLFHVRPVAVLVFCVSWFNVGFKTYCFSLFLRRCMERRLGIAMRKLSVCPSVCLSVKRVHCDKTEERSVQIFIPYERSFSLVF